MIEETTKLVTKDVTEALEEIRDELISIRKVGSKNVEPPVINIPKADPPNVVVNIPEKKSRKIEFKIHRDLMNNITSVTAEEK